MNPDRIEQLLREADQGGRIASGTNAGEFADQVLSRFRRRQAIRTGGSAAVVLLIVSGSVLMLSRHHEIPREYAREETSPRGHAGNVMRSGTTGSISGSDRLSDQIAYQEQVIDRMLAAEQRARREATLLEIDLPSADRPIERAAALAVYAADRVASNPEAPTAPAVHAYDRVIDSFPDTVSAELARRRLAELRKKDKEG